MATPQTPRSQRTIPVPHWVVEPVPFRASPANLNQMQGTPWGPTSRPHPQPRPKKRARQGRSSQTYIGDYIAQKIDEWTKAGLTEALGLGSEINNTVQKYCENLSKDGTGSQGSTSAPGNKTISPSWASVAAKGTKSPKAQAATPKAASTPPGSPPASQQSIRLGPPTPMRHSISFAPSCRATWAA